MSGDIHVLKGNR